MVDEAPALPPRDGAVDPTWPVRTQRLVGEVVAICDDWLREPLRACLNDFDLHLPEHAGAPGSAVDQQGCQNTLRRLVQVGDTFAPRFVDHLHWAFAQLGTASVPSVPSSLAAAPSLSLLDPMHQALDAALDRLVQRSEVQGGATLVEIGYRLAVLVAAPPLEGKALPLAPHALIAAFRAASIPLELPDGQQLLLVQSLDSAMMRRLSTLYAAVNTCLQREGILPALRTFSVPRAQPRKARSSFAPDTTLPVVPEPSTAAATAPAQSADEGRVESAPGTASDTELRTALDAVQWTFPGYEKDRGGAAGWRQLHAALIRQLNVAGATAAGNAHLSASQARSMAQVVRWFREAQSQLPHDEAVETLLGDLQWPLLRVVLYRPELAAQSGHPAYRLLRKVVELARDWLPCGADGKPDALVRTQLTQLLGPIVHEASDAAACDAVCAEIERLLEQWRGKARVAERRHVEAMRGRDRLERARRRATDLLAARLASALASDPLRALFDDAWADVLALALLRHGESSELFATLLVITDQLLGELPMGDRQRLQQDVEAGLQQIGLYGDQAVRMAHALIDTGAATRAGHGGSRSELSATRRAHARDPGAVASPAGGSFAGFVPGSPQDIVLQHLREARVGGWYEFVDAEDAMPRQRRLAWFSALSGRCLFVTRRGQRATEMDLQQLADAIVGGSVRELRPDADEQLSEPADAVALEKAPLHPDADFT
ncbi:MAG: DUF1631 family protein [Rhodanobacter sp.]